MYLLENGIVHYQNGGGDNYVHNRIAREALSPSVGSIVEVPLDNGTAVVNYSFTIPSNSKLANLEVLAFVQCPFGDQAVVQSGDYGDWYVDNCRNVAVGATAPLEVQ